MPSALLGPLGTLARTSTVHASLSSQGRAGQHRDAQTHWFFAQSLSDTQDKVQGNREIEREKPQPSCPHFTGRTSRNLSRRRLAAGWGQAACSQQQRRRRQSERSSIGMYVRAAVALLLGATDGRSLGASTPHSSGVELEPSGTENASRPALPNVAGSRDGGQFMTDERLSGVCRPWTKFWIGSALRRAIGGFPS